MENIVRIVEEVRVLVGHLGPLAVEIGFAIITIIGVWKLVCHEIQK